MYESSIVVTMATALGCLSSSRGDLSCSVCEGQLERRVTEKERGTGEGGARREQYVCECLIGYYGLIGYYIWQLALGWSVSFLK